MKVSQATCSSFVALCTLRSLTVLWKKKEKDQQPQHKPGCIKSTLQWNKFDLSQLNGEALRELSSTYIPFWLLLLSFRRFSLLCSHISHRMSRTNDVMISDKKPSSGRHLWYFLFPALQPVAPSPRMGEVRNEAIFFGCEHRKPIQAEWLFWRNVWEYFERVFISQ